MPGFLAFQLYGPLASWGDIAVGERRGSWNRPSKSAMIGLLAAALGIRRDEAEAQAALAAGYGMMVRVDTPGVLLRDYHTAQTVREGDLKRLRKADPRPLTRRRQMAVDSPETVLSQRDYRCDAYYTVVLWPRPAAPYALERLAEALRHPAFVLYLGRKSCPPALPLWPAVIAAADAAEAMAAYVPPEMARVAQAFAALRQRRAAAADVVWEDDAVPQGHARVRIRHAERRRDVPGDRRRWHFAEREEHVGTWVETP